MKLWVLLLSLALVLVATPAEAHGSSRITRGHINAGNGYAKAGGNYVTQRKHQHLVASIFIIQGDLIIGEKTKRCSDCRRIHIQLKVMCHTPNRAVSAVIQGDAKAGKHFAIWNSKKIGCISGSG